MKQEREKGKECVCEKEREENNWYENKNGFCCLGEQPQRQHSCRTASVSLSLSFLFTSLLFSAFLYLFIAPAHAASCRSLTVQRKFSTRNLLSTKNMATFFAWQPPQEKRKRDKARESQSVSEWDRKIECYYYCDCPRGNFVCFVSLTYAKLAWQSLN